MIEQLSLTRLNVGLMTCQSDGTQSDHSMQMRGALDLITLAKLPGDAQVKGQSPALSVLMVVSPEVLLTLPWVK